MDYLVVCPQLMLSVFSHPALAAYSDIPGGSNNCNNNLLQAWWQKRFVGGSGEEMKKGVGIRCGHVVWA
jgi:hypothetical protein